VTLRHRILKRLLADDPTSSRPAGATALLALRGVAQTKPYLTRYLPAALLAATLPPISILAITVADPLSGLIVLATIPLVPLFAALVGARTKDRADRQWRELGSLAGHFVDVVRGLPTLVVFRRAERQTAVIRQITHRYRRATVETLRLAFASSAVLELIATLSVALVAVDVGVRLAAGHLGLGTALFVLLLAPEAYWPVRRAGAEFHAAAEGTAAFADADALLTAEPGDSFESGTEPVGPIADIEVRNVSVDWQDGAPPGLAPLSARLPAPGLVAVQGPSGAGKTTFLGVLQGRIPPTAGEVRVNGRGLSDLSPAWWRQQVAWLPQRPMFVRGTIGDNLRLGGPRAGDADLWNALSAVGLRDRVASMNGGLDAGLQQDGGNLSAGERARLALARVLVADRPIVLLDEPSAHLDLETERRIAEVIVDISRRALVVVVTHRDTLASYADHVIELGQTCTLEPAPTAAWPSRDHHDVPAPSSPSAVPDDAEEPVPASGRWRQVLAIMLGSLASLSGVALTATAGWLIVTASSQPPVLALLVAIVAVRTFGIARPVLRYVERLWSHDVALRLLADRRAAVYAALVPLTPGQLGRRRGELLGNVVDDVEAFVDRRLRFQLPLATMLCAGTVAAALVTLVAPSAGLVDGGLLLAAGVGVFALVRSAVERTDLALTSAGVQLGDEVTGLVEARDELRSWDAQDRALEATVATGSQFERLARRISVVTGLGRAVAGGVAGLAVAATLTIVAPLVGTGRVTAAMAGLLVLVPLALFDLVQSAADAAGWEVRTRHALDRLRVITDRPPLVADPTRPLPWPGGHTDVALQQVSAGWGGSVVLTGINA
ncbi:MAG: thiol reductant ABC exporter subunit CydD, partial [Nocardioidaceae bacterium]